MTPRRPSLVFLILIRLPYVVGALIIAWIVLLMVGCSAPDYPVVNHAARILAPFPALAAERDLAAPELALTPAKQTGTVLLIERLTNCPPTWLNEIHHSDNLTDPLPWPTLATFTNSPFLTTNRFGHIWTNSAPFAGNLAAGYFYRVAFGFDGKRIH